MELIKKICPFFGVGHDGSLRFCRKGDCALWVDIPGNESGCALAVLAEGMKEAADELPYIAANML